MTASSKAARCAIYTRVSSDSGLEQEFNSLDAQYDAASAYIRSQAHAHWTPVRTRYDDGGYSGGTTDRPALQRLLADVQARKIQVVVVYKVDRLTRSLADVRSAAQEVLIPRVFAGGFFYCIAMRDERQSNCQTNATTT